MLALCYDYNGMSIVHESTEPGLATGAQLCGGKKNLLQTSEQFI